MKTGSNTIQLKLQALHSGDIITKFDAGNIPSDSFSPLLREVEKRTQIFQGLSNCFTDCHNPFIEHIIDALIKQQVLGIAMGYEDLNDHDHL